MKRRQGWMAILWGGLLAGVLLWGAGAAEASRVRFRVAPSHPLVLTGQKQRIYLKIGLTGFAIEQSERSPVNLALVIDRSGSMQGAKIRKAKEAARMVLDLLRPNDIFSLVTYNSTVQVLVPATKVGDKQSIERKIKKIRASGFTALFGGVSKGISEVSKFLNRNRVNRVLLISDGLANVGPSSPNALGRLGEASAKQGIAISTIGLGLGYNEDLMSRLALKSDGNHAFARNAHDLARIFRGELGELLSVVAQNVYVTITCTPGVKPLRIIDRVGEIRGQTVALRLNQLYSRQEKYILLEVEVPSGRLGHQQSIATAQLRYRNMQTRKRDQLSNVAQVRYTNNARLVQKRVNRKVMIQVSEAIGNVNNRRAVKLRDQGKVETARRLIMRNATYLERQSKRYRSKLLRRSSADNKKDARNLRGRKWKKRRKLMRDQQYRRRMQRSY